MRKRTTLVTWLIAVTFFAGGSATTASSADADQESDFKFRFVGPKVGNRIAAVAGVPDDPSIYYAGAASGGIFKSVDGGNRWEPSLRQAVGRRDRRPGGRTLRAKYGLGGHRRGMGDSRQRRHGQRHLQVPRCRQDLDQYGAARFRAHRPDHRPPIEPRHCICLRARTGDRPPTGARRLPDDRWWPALGRGCCSQENTRLLRTVHWTRTIRTP